MIAGPLCLYLFIIGCLAPTIYWYFRIRKRAYRLGGRYNDVSRDFKGGWVFSIISCMRGGPLLCFSLPCCIIARLADTWDSLDYVRYWGGVRKAFCCFVLYLIGCWP